MGCPKLVHVLVLQACAGEDLENFEEFPCIHLEANFFGFGFFHFKDQIATEC